MGRAIVRQPAAFLFDEPLSNLDAKLRVSMRGEIRKLQRRLGTTSLYVTHDQLEAMTLADRLVVLNGGRVEQIGAPLEVYHRPASTFVASFIGSPAMNLMDARIEAGRLRIDDHDIAPAALPDRAVVLGIRPEDVLISGKGGLPMKIDYVEELGAQRIVHGMIGGQVLAVADASAVPLSDTVALTVRKTRLHLFDVEHGRRLPELAAQEMESAD
jgi:sn-glycerol 3-phosphate transport system ATP-binding protein